MSSTQPRACCIYLFDIDGTLIGGDGAGRRAFERAVFEVAGIEEALGGMSLGGMTDPLILAEAFQRKAGRAPGEAEAAEVLRVYLRHLALELTTSEYHVKPGVSEALDHLEREGAVIGLATGNIEGGARLKLERGDLWRRFPFGGFGSDAADRGELVRVAVARGKARAPGPPEQVLVIGDTPRDVTAAHAAGVPCVAVATGPHGVDDLRRAGADAVFPTLCEWLDSL